MILRVKGICERVIVNVSPQRGHQNILRLRQMKGYFTFGKRVIRVGRDN